VLVRGDVDDDWVSDTGDDDEDDDDWVVIT
jgi:hypothetical protein